MVSMSNIKILLIFFINNLDRNIFILSGNKTKIFSSKETIIFFIEWPEAESNCRPLVFQTSALPTELSGLYGGDDGIRTRDLLRDRQA